MKTLEDKKNDLLRRRELKLIVEATKNPSMDEAAKMVAENFKAAEENIVIKSIKGQFGRNTFLIVASIYTNKEDKDKTETKSKKLRDAEKKAAAEGAKKPGVEAEKKEEA